MWINHKRTLIVCYIISYFFMMCSYAKTIPVFDLLGYQKQNGAITLGYRGDFVDPYFAMRALITAREEGLDTRKAAIAWIKWLIKRQRPDGRFARYCNIGGKFIACMQADADDVNMALWAQLLTEFAQDQDMPLDWRQSYDDAMNYLQKKLYDPQQKIYHVSYAKPVGLLMDNVEIAHAFFQIAWLKKQQGDLVESLLMALCAYQLTSAIEKVFGTNSGYEVSTQPNQTQGFYPGAIAQIYPWIFPIPSKFFNSKTNFMRWYNRWHVFLTWPQSDYAWGLVAIAAKKSKNTAILDQWLFEAETLRPYKKWNVVDEMAYQVLKKIAV